MLGGVVYLMLILGVSFVLVALGLILGKNTSLSREKLSSFECGFDPMESSRNTFSLRFFLLAIVFLIFDVELVLFLPYLFSLAGGVGISVVLGMVLFILILMGGLAHEFNEGSLDWSE